MWRAVTWCSVLLVVACSGEDANSVDAGQSAAADSAPAIGGDASPVTSVDAGVVATCDGLAPMQGRSVLTIDSGGISRQFRLYVPPSYDPSQPMAVVVNFHGLTSNASQQEAFSAMVAKAEAEGFIAVHPDGVGNSWNAGPCCGTAASSDVDDVGFASDVLDEVESMLCVDRRRVYATGMSNGGFMSHRLACEMSDRIAAIAPVAGGNITSACNPGRPMPVMHFHGTDDTTVGYQGAASSIAGWAARNGCDSTTQVVYEQGTARCAAYQGCPAGNEVILCTVTGFGHWWPGAFGASDDIDATDALWEFFTRHTLP